MTSPASTLIPIIQEKTLMALNDGEVRNSGSLNSHGSHVDAYASFQDEISLYEELVAFVELSPEEQRSYLERQYARSPQIVSEITPAETLASEPLLPEHFGSEIVSVPFETEFPADANATFVLEPSSTEIVAEDVETNPFILAAKPVSADEAVIKPLAESQSASAKAEDSGQRRQASFELPDLFRATGPLAGLMPRPEVTFTGAMTKGVCLACGAESGVEDLFCMTCGAFIDEVDSTLKLNPSCTECGQRIVTDEIFCPWCGAVLPA